MNYQTTGNTIFHVRQYPLYDELLRKTNERSEKGIDIRKVCTTINNIAQLMRPEDANEHYREIGALMLHHELMTTGAVSISGAPYESKIMHGGKGVLVQSNNLPPILLQIIAQYIEESSVH